MDGGRSVRQHESRPAIVNRVGIQYVVGDAVGIHRREVVIHRDVGIRRVQIEPTGHRHELLAGLVLQASPVVVGTEGQGHILRRVIAVPDDPRRVMRGAALVTEPEGLEAQNAQTSTGGMPGGGTSQPAESDDGQVIGRPVIGFSHRFHLHVARAGEAASAGYRGLRPPSARTSPESSTASSCHVARIRRSPNPAG